MNNPSQSELIDNLFASQQRNETQLRALLGDVDALRADISALNKSNKANKTVDAEETNTINSINKTLYTVAELVKNLSARLERAEKFLAPDTNGIPKLQADTIIAMAKGFGGELKSTTNEMSREVSNVKSEFKTVLVGIQSENSQQKHISAATVELAAYKLQEMARFFSSNQKGIAPRTAKLSGFIENNLPLGVE